jgi:DNA-binding transcriptional ArsR family regulator
MLVLLAHPPGARSGPFADSERGMCVSDLRARIGRAQALVSHHVQVLLRAGLIRRVRGGRRSLLQLDTRRVAALGDQIAALASHHFQIHPPGSGRVEAPVPGVPARIGSSAVPVLAPDRPIPRGGGGGTGPTGAASW